MKNKYFFLTFLFLSLYAFSYAQDSLIVKKYPIIGIVDRNILLEAMPEKNKLDRELAAFNQSYVAEYDVMVKNYNQKVKAYLENAKGLNETIKMARQAEVTEMEARMATYKTNYLKALDSYKKEALKPIEEKLNNAINSISTEKSLTVLLDKTNILFIGADCVDITESVKSKLGL